MVSRPKTELIASMIHISLACLSYLSRSKSPKRSVRSNLPQYNHHYWKVQSRVYFELRHQIPVHRRRRSYYNPPVQRPSLSSDLNLMDTSKHSEWLLSFDK